MKRSARMECQRASEWTFRLGRQCLCDSTVTRCDPSLPGALPAPTTSVHGTMQGFVGFGHSSCLVGAPALRSGGQTAPGRPGEGFAFPCAPHSPRPARGAPLSLSDRCTASFNTPAGPRGPRQQLRALGGGRCLGPIQVPHRAAHHSSRSGQQPPVEPLSPTPPPPPPAAAAEQPPGGLLRCARVP